MEIFKQLRIAGTLEGIYQDYCYCLLRDTIVTTPNNRRWLAKVIDKGITGGDGSPVWVKDAHPGLYADLAAKA